MAAIALEDSLSKGHDDESWPKTLPESGLSEKTKVNGKYVVLSGQTKYAPHKKDKTTHTADMRKVSSGSSKAKIEGHPIARINDTLDDGDIINQGYSKVNVG
jgi:uncharacterized Zn-binding protein involved in type VI secretion